MLVLSLSLIINLHFLAHTKAFEINQLFDQKSIENTKENIYLNAQSTNTYFYRAQLSPCLSTSNHTHVANLFSSANKMNLERKKYKPMFECCEFLEPIRDAIDHKLEKYPLASKFVDWLRRNCLSMWAASIVIFRAPFLIFCLIFTIFFTRRLKRPQLSHWPTIKKFSGWGVLLFLVMMIENMLVYIIAYMDEDKYKYESLNDNMDNLMEYLLKWETVVYYTEYINRCDSGLFMMVLGFFVIYCNLFGRYRIPRMNIWGWGVIVAKAIIFLRIMRISSFMAVIIPNGRPHCFADKFIVA